MWLVGMVLRRYIDFLILLIPSYSSCICSFLEAASLLFVHCLILIVIFINIIIIGKRKRAHPCLLNLSNFCYIYLFIYRFIYIYIYIFQAIRRARAVNAQCTNVGPAG